MAVKILSKPNFEDIKFKWTCGSCTSVLEAGIGDYILHPGCGDQRDWDPEHFSVTCPVCHASKRVPEDKAPPGLKEFLRRRRGPQFHTDD